MNFNVPFSQISPAQRGVLIKLCHESKAKTILELGSWVGESTSALAGYAKENGAKVVCVDW